MIRRMPVIGSSLITSWLSTGGRRPVVEEPEPGRPVEHEPDLGLRRRQALAGADEPGTPAQRQLSISSLIAA